MATNPFSIPQAIPGLYQNQGIQSRDNLNELDPEAALEAQNLNRKQQIANLLMQKGLQPIQGVQTGRFYVPPSWAQGLAQLGYAGLGAGLTKHLGEEQADIGRQAGEQRAQAVQDYMKNTSPQEVTTEQEGPGAPIPRYTPQELQQLATGLTDTTPVGELANDQQEGPRPTTTTMQAPTDDMKRQALIKVLTSRDPSIRRFGELQSQQQAAEKEHGIQRDFLHQENIDKMKAKLESDKNHIDLLTGLKLMTLDEGAKAKKDADDRHATLLNELEKSRSSTQRDIAKGHDETTLEAARIRAEAAGNKGNAKQDAQEAKVEAGRNTVSSLVATLGDAYDQLDQAGGITNPDKSAMANIQAGAASSGPGQMVGKLLGTQNQSLRNQIVQQRPLLLNAIKEATGMSAKQMDSNAELKMYLSAATDPNIDIKANRAALAKLEELYGLGGKTATAAPSKAGQPSLDDLLNKYK